MDGGCDLPGLRPGRGDRLLAQHCHPPSGSLADHVGTRRGWNHDKARVGVDGVDHRVGGRKATRPGNSENVRRAIERIRVDIGDRDDLDPVPKGGQKIPGPDPSESPGPDQDRPVPGPGLHDITCLRRSGAGHNRMPIQRIGPGAWNPASEPASGDRTSERPGASRSGPLVVDHAAGAAAVRCPRPPPATPRL